MVSALHEEFEHLATCEVKCPLCLYEYQDAAGSRKPKVLPCSHTLCLQCLEVISMFFTFLWSNDDISLSGIPLFAGYQQEGW